MLPGLRFITPAVRVALDGGDPFVETTAAAHGAATSPRNLLRPPTRAQELAGNYPMGHVDWRGMVLMIENPAHTVREGEDPSGKPWRSLMKAHYGYIRGTRGADGDEIDVFLGPAPESPRAWVLNQTDAAGKFDEHKVMLGFHDERSAVDAYRLSYEPGWSRFKTPVPVTVDQLKWWLQWGDTTRELHPEHLPPEPENMETKPNTNPLPRVFWDSAAMPAAGETVGSVLYALRVDDAQDGLLLDPMTLGDVHEGVERQVEDALVVQAGKLQWKMNALLRIMDVAASNVKPVAVQVSDPVRRYGGVHVAVIFEMSDGQTVTAWFHNPDASPAKLTPADDLVSWKWQLNKKDITIVVAPERGTDLNTREVARRIMRLVDKNSAAFARANAGRAARMEEIEDLKQTLVGKQAELAGLHRRIEVALVERADRQAAAAAPQWKRRDFDPTTPAGYAAVMAAGTEAQLHWQDRLDSLFQERLVAVRNALRALGWEGDRFAALSKIIPGGAGGIMFQLATDFTQVGAGRNVVSVVYSVRRVEAVGANGFTVPITVIDDLTSAPEQIAAALDAVVPKEEPKPEPKPEPVDPNVAAMVAGAMTPGYAEWEEALTRLVVERQDVSNGDAQGMLEAVDMTKGAGTLLRMFRSNYEPEAAYASLFPEQPASVKRWRVTNKRGYSAVHEGETEIRAIQAAMATTDEHVPSSEWRAVEEGDAPEPQPETEPEPAAPADLGLEDVTPGAAELLAENAAALATAKAIEADVKQQGGAVAWSETSQEPDVPVLDSASLVVDAAGADLEAVVAAPKFAKSLAAAPKKFGLDDLITRSGGRGGAVTAPKKLDAGGISKMRNVIARAVAGGDMRKLVDMQGALKSLSDEVIEKVYQAVREAMGLKLNLDSLFELDGARFVRGDITYRGRAMGAVTINGTGEAFFTNPDGSAYNPALDGLTNQTDEDIAEANREAMADGRMGWTRETGDVVGWLLSVNNTDQIDEEIDEQTAKAENADQDREDDGGAWPATVLDRDNPHWKLTLNDAPETGAKPTTKVIGTLRKGGQELVASAVYRGKSAARWYIVLTRAGQRKMVENIPFPTIAGIYKMGRIASILMGYLDADEPSGWRIAPPGSDAGKEDPNADRNPVLVHAQAVRQELVKLGYQADGNTLRVERDGALITVKWDYEGPEDAPTDVSFRAYKLVGGVQVDDFAGFAVMGTSPEVAAAKLDAYVREMRGAPEPTPEPADNSPDLAFLKDVLRGAHDALALSDLLEKIEASVMGLQEAGQLTGEADRIANEAITRWAELDQKING